MKRLAFYVFWDKDGIVYDHVTDYLCGLKEVAQNVVLIANGLLSEDSRKKLERMGVDFLVRENRGIDFAAWKAALDRQGWNEVVKYDELILCNCTCYGPVYPFSEMFSVMEKRDCDFWGLNRQPDLPDKLIGPEEGSFPLKGHIQSYFYVFKKTALISECFWKWWDTFIPSENYWDEVRDHELEFSGYLERAGLKSDTYMDFAKYDALAPESMACYKCADIQLTEDRNPLVKRKLIFSSTDVSWRTFLCIHNNTSYPIKHIIDDLKRNTPMSVWAYYKYCILSLICSGSRKQHYRVKMKKYRLMKKGGF